jgi:hypothetical protein
VAAIAAPVWATLTASTIPPVVPGTDTDTGILFKWASIWLTGTELRRWGHMERVIVRLMVQTNPKTVREALEEVAVHSIELVEGTKDGLVVLEDLDE